MKRGASAIAAMLVIPCVTATLLARSPGQATRAAGPPPLPAPTGTGVIAGRVVAADTGRPIRRPRVTLSSASPVLTRVLVSSDEGTFSFQGLPAASYAISVTKPGMLNASYGQKVTGSGRLGTPIQLGEGQRLDQINIPMARAGVLTGTVLDEAGDPALGASVQAMRFAVTNGVRRLQPAGTATADDRGIYRIINLIPGEYVVSALGREVSGSDAQRAAEALRHAETHVTQARQRGEAAVPVQGPGEPKDGYTQVYYPNSSNGPAAATIPLGIGEERTGVDLQLSRVPIAPVSGTASLPDGLRMIADLRLVDRAQLTPAQAIRLADVERDGRFTFAGVPPGQYSIVAFAGPPGAISEAMPIADLRRLLETQPVAAPRAQVTRRTQPETWFAAVDVATAGQPVDGIALTFQRGMSISGRVAFAGGPPPADLTKLAVTVSAAGVDESLFGGEQPGAVAGTLDAEGRFTIKGVLPGTYRLTLPTAIPGFTMRSAIFGGRDALDFPLEVKAGEDIAGGEISLTTRLAELSGAVTNNLGARVTNCTVVVFPSDTTYWTPMARRIQAVGPTSTGRYSVRGLPAGQYRVAAVYDVGPGEWFEPHFLRELQAGAVTVTIAEGGQAVQDLQVR